MGFLSKPRASAPVNIITVPNTLVLALAIIGGILEYLNQNTFGFSTQVQEAVRYGILVITAFGVTIPVGRELGVDIVTLLKVPTWVLLLITILAYAIAAAVSAFGISGIWKGIILGVVAFITTVFGPAPQDVIIQPTPVPVSPGGSTPAPVPAGPISPAATPMVRRGYQHFIDIPGLGWLTHSSSVAGFR
jgi:hypothetical protein